MRQLTLKLNATSVSWVVDQDCALLAAYSTTSGALLKDPTDSFGNYATPTANVVVDSFVILLTTAISIFYFLPVPVMLLKGETVTFTGSSGTSKGSAVMFLDP